MACVSEPAAILCGGPPQAETAVVLKDVCPGCLAIYLDSQRQIIGKMLAKRVSDTAWRMMSTWTAKLLGFVEKLYGDAWACYGGPPSEFAFCITGSGARGEACPQSDLDAFIVVPKITVSQRQQWRKVNQTVSDRLAKVNKLQVNSLRPGKGFVFCTGGLNPIGQVSLEWAAQHDKKKELLKDNRVIVSLTNDAYSLAGILETYYSNPNDPNNRFYKHIVSGLQEFAFGFGTKKHSEDLRTEVNRVMGKSAVGAPPNSDFSRKRDLGLKAMKTAATDKNFQPPSASSKFMRVKREFYRAPQFVLKGLAWYYQMDDVSSLAQLKSLINAKKLHSSRAYHFRKAMSEALKLRVASHLFTGAEFDKVLAAGVRPVGSQSDWLQLDDQQTQALRTSANSVLLIISWAKEFVASHEKGPGRPSRVFASPV